MVKDPICGMEVDPAKAKFKIEEKKAYFCSKDCLEKYEQKHNLKPALTRKTWFKVLLYTVIVILLIGLTALLQTTGYMILFMGIFFVVVSFLKFLDWKGFAQAFAMYDLIAKKSRYYALAYPFIELALGLAYLFSFQIVTAAIITFIIMSVGSIGVAKNLLSKNPIKCACLGTKIKLPLTKFTFFEDITMAIMALMVLFL